MLRGSKVDQDVCMVFFPPFFFCLVSCNRFWILHKMSYHATMRAGQVGLSFLSFYRTPPSFLHPHSTPTFFTLSHLGLDLCIHAWQSTPFKLCEAWSLLHAFKVTPGPGGWPCKCESTTWTSEWAQLTHLCSAISVSPFMLLIIWSLNLFRWTLFPSSRLHDITASYTGLVSWSQW